MPSNSRPAVGVHCLIYLAQAAPEVRSSAQIAESLASNPVLVRRILGRLRTHGLVWSVEGAGGGWQLSRPAEEITLGDVHRAMADGAPLIPTHARTPSSACVIGRNLPTILAAEFESAQRALEDRLDGTSIADLLTAVTRADAAITHSR